MMRCLFVILMVAALAGSATAATNLYDDFENGVGGDIVYTPWNGTPGDPTTPFGNDNLVTTATNEHSKSGIRSARAWASDPAAWNGYADFGATMGAVRASVWVYEDKTDPGTTHPVTNMLSLYGDASNPNLFTDYLQVGVVPFYPAGSQGYGWRSLSDGINDASPATVRKAGWTNLVIEADALASGGQVRFYVDDVLVGTSARASGVALRYVRIGNNSKSYETFWYDDLSVVVPEPSSLLALASGGLLLVGSTLRRRKRS